MMTVAIEVIIGDNDVDLFDQAPFDRGVLMQ